MEKFRKILKRRMVIYVVAVLLAAALYVFCLWYFKGFAQPTHEWTFQGGVSSGIFFAVAAATLRYFMRWRKAMRDDEFCKKLHASETDERTLFIGQKTLAVSWMLSYYALIAAMLISGFLSQTVFQVLIFVMMGLALIRLGTRLYYSRKF